MSIFELIETFLDPILTASNGGLILSVGFIIVITIMLGIINVSKPIILITSISLFLMFISFGWIPLWIVILLILIIFGLFITNIIGGRSGA